MCCSLRCVCNRAAEIAKRPTAPVLKTGGASHLGSSNLPLRALFLININFRDYISNQFWRIKYDRRFTRNHNGKH